MRIGPVLLPLRGTHGAALPAYDSLPLPALENQQEVFGRGDDAVGNPQRAQIVQFELFELTLSLKLDRQLSIEQFEATVCQSAVPSPPLRYALTVVLAWVSHPLMDIRDKNLYTTTNKCLQCLLEIMYSVF